MSLRVGRSHVGVLTPRVRGRNGARHKRGVEHPQVRNGSCKRRSHVGVLTPPVEEGTEHVISEEWSTPRCGTGSANTVRTWACSLRVRGEERSMS
jgi:hypothetical protein